MKRATIPTVLLLCCTFAQAAWGIEGFRRFRKGDWETNLGGSFFYTDANYKGSSSTERLPGSNTYQLIDVNLSTRYVTSPYWALKAGLNIGNAESKNTGTTRSNSSLTGALLGLEYVVDYGALQFVPEFSFLMPFEKNSFTQDTVMTSEGVTESRAKLGVQTVFDSFNFFGSIGYTMRGEGRSTLLPWSVGLEFPFKGYSFGARIFGYETVKNDSDTGSSGESARLATIARVNAGSQKFFAVNPALVDTEAFFKYFFSRSLSLGIAGGMTLSGARAAAGFHGDAVLTYRFSTVPIVRRSTPADANRLTIDPNVDQFREDTDDGIDQQIFRPAPTPKEKPPAPRRKPKPAAPQTRTTPTETETQTETTTETAEAEDDSKIDEEDQRRIQQQLDDAEYSIQLKANQRKKK